MGEPTDGTQATDALESQLEALLSEGEAAVARREQTAFDEQAAPWSESLVLFGAGRLGRKTLAGLRRVGLEPLAFADNNPALWAQAVDGLPVLSPEVAAREYGERAAFVVTIWRAGGGHRLAHTRQQLLALNCRKVVSFAALFWKYADVFLPYYAIALPHTLQAQASQIRRALALWADDDSRREYVAQVRWRWELDFEGLPSPVAHAQYFPEDLVALANDEVFVDCGAYDGDTLRQFLARLPAFGGQVIALEPDPASLRSLRELVAGLGEPLSSHLRVLPLAAGSRRERLRFDETGTAASAVSAAGALEVDCAPLDEILEDTPPTFIKMDIEGAELEALAGARAVIARSAPVLAIGVYHRPDHLWRVPLLLHSLTEQYRFFLRPHNEEGWDLVCYAVPAGRLREAQASR